MMMSPSLPGLCHLDRHVFPLSFASVVFPLSVVSQLMLLCLVVGVIELSALSVRLVALHLGFEPVLEQVEVSASVLTRVLLCWA